MQPSKVILVGVIALGAGDFLAIAQGTELSPLWTLAPGSRSYLTADNTQRGMDYNPVTKNLLLVNRAGGLQVVKLDSMTGSELGTLSLGDSVVTGGTFAGSMLGVADDGAVYLGNLTTDSTVSPYKLYRWTDENAVPTVAFSGDPSSNLATGGANSKRFGDTMDVRGAGANTQVLLAARGGGDVSVLLTPDGSNFAGIGADTDAGVDAGNGSDIGLGIAFGSGNTLWGTALGRTLRHIDVVLPAGNTIGNFGGAEGVPTSITMIGVDAANGWLAGVDLIAGPDKVHLFDISSGTPSLLSTVSLTADNANINGVGAVALGDGKLFVLDTNNGIHAYSIIPEPETYALLGLGLAVVWYARRRIV